LRRLERTQRFTDLAIVIAVLINAAALFLVSNKLIDNLTGIVGNLVASAIVAVLVAHAKLVPRRG
jgi:hypothetical protein